MNTPWLTTRGIDFGYVDGERVIQGVDFDLPPGDLLALIGHNGSGKTTLAKLLGGFLMPTAGRVLLDGRDVSQHSLHTRASHISVVWQDPDQQIFSDTVRDELAFGPRNLGLEADEVDRRLQQAASQFGLSAVLDERPAELSYGQRRLVALAAIAVLQRPIMILDEPTLGLEPHLAHLVLARLADLRRAGHSIVLITHDLPLAMEYARSCVLMSGGQIAAAGRIDELLADHHLLIEHGFKLPPLAQLAARLPGWPSRLPQLSVAGWRRHLELAGKFDLI